MFEWDPIKAERNVKKHGVRFEEAATAFDDPRGLSGLDILHSARELRWKWIGQSAANRVLMVVFTMRSVGDGETIRIISARRANRAEKHAYAAD